jgi:uridine kinase
MKTKTIQTQFDLKSLPRWAQNDQNIIALCERDLSFRDNVFDATTAQYRQTLKRQAERAIDRLKDAAQAKQAASK